MSEPRLYICYDPDFPDACVPPDTHISAEVDHWIKSWKESNETDPDDVFTVICGTAYMIDEFRLRIIRDELSHNDVVFQHLYQHPDGSPGELIPVDRFGQLKSWPRGFCDHETVRLSELMTAAQDKRQKEKDQK